MLPPLPSPRANTPPKLVGVSDSDTFVPDTVVGIQGADHTRISLGVLGNQLWLNTTSQVIASDDLGATSDAYAFHLDANRDTTMKKLVSDPGRTLGTGSFQGAHFSEDGSIAAFDFLPFPSPSTGPARMAYMVRTGTSAVTLLSKDGSGTPAIGQVLDVSGNGKYVYFRSTGPGLTPENITTGSKIYRYNTMTDQIEPVFLGQRNSDGTPRTTGSVLADTNNLQSSHDGTIVAAETSSGSIVRYHFPYIFSNGVITEVNFFNPNGVAPFKWKMSGNGQYIVYLDNGETQTSIKQAWSCLYRGSSGPLCEVMSKDGSGNEADQDVADVVINRDARYVSFKTEADLDPTAPGQGGVYALDRGTNRLFKMAAPSPTGGTNLIFLAISPEGKRIAFTSFESFDARHPAGGSIPVPAAYVIENPVWDIESNPPRSSVSVVGRRYLASINENANNGANNLTANSELEDFRTINLAPGSSTVSWVTNHDQTGEFDEFPIGKDLFYRNLATGPTQTLERIEEAAQADDGCTFVVTATVPPEGVTNQPAGLQPIGGAPLAYLVNVCTETAVLLDRSSGGDWGNGQSKSVRITPDGRYAFFLSSSSNLVTPDTNGTSFNNGFDLFRYDANTQTLIRVMGPVTYSQTFGNINLKDVSHDGNTVLIRTNHTDLLSNGVLAGHLLIDVAPAASLHIEGALGTTDTSLQFQDLSGNGRFVLIDGDTLGGLGTGDNGAHQSYLFDRTDSSVQVVSKDSSGNEQTTQKGLWVNPDGTKVLFASLDPDLDARIASLPNLSKTQIFLRDLGTGTTRILSIDPCTGEPLQKDPQINDFSAAVMTADGTRLRFLTLASFDPIDGGSSSFSSFVTGKDIYEIPLPPAH